MRLLLQGYPPVKYIQILLFIVSMTQLEPINIIRSSGTDREMPLIIYRSLDFIALRLSPRRHFSLSRRLRMLQLTVVA